MENLAESERRREGYNGRGRVQMCTRKVLTDESKWSGRGAAGDRHSGTGTAATRPQGRDSTATLTVHCVVCTTTGDSLGAAHCCQHTGDNLPPRRFTTAAALPTPPRHISLPLPRRYIDRAVRRDVLSAAYLPFLLRRLTHLMPNYLHFNDSSPSVRLSESACYHSGFHSAFRVNLETVGNTASVMLNQAS
ncbi:hypothetical protein J6590_058335 [Homalodisca vitripennis]|nr:hypothetical protein J6590_058335 [Homalodisca vitripennis]